MQGGEWKKVHAELTRLARAKGEYDADEARWLVEGKRVRVHEALGYSTLLEYLERLFGYGPRRAKERLRVAEALVELPVLSQALGSAILSWSTVRELSRVAVPATEAEWLAAAQDKTVRQVEEMVCGRKPGDRPGDPASAGAARHVLRLEVSADSLAAFRDARRRIELDVGHSLDDDALVRMLAHYALGGPDQPGRAAYQVAMTVCEACGRGTRDGSGRPLDVETHQVEAALCDAQEISLTHVGQDAQPAAQSIPPRIRRLVWRRDHGRCQILGCRSARFLEVHHIVPRSHGGTHDPLNLSVMCSAHHALIHRGVLVLEGAAPDRLTVRHADGRAYGEREGPPAAETEAVDALRRMGVAGGDARRAVAKAAASGADRLEDVLRQALIDLRWTTYASRASEAARSYRSRWASPATATM